jgi:hypothetical protein
MSIRRRKRPAGRTLLTDRSSCHPATPRGVALSEAQTFSRRDVMKRLMMILIPLALMAMSGCVVAPYGYYHRPYYYGARVAVVAPAPVVVVRP